MLQCILVATDFSPAARRAVARAAHKADLVVIGARGENESTVRGPTLGGTALKSLTAMRLPLLLVRHTVTGPYAKVLAAVDASQLRAHDVAEAALDALVIA